MSDERCRTCRGPIATRHPTAPYCGECFFRPYANSGMTKEQLRGMQWGSTCKKSGHSYWACPSAEVSR